MSIKLVRNKSFEPFIDREGFYIEKPPTVNKNGDKIFHEKLEPNERLFHHNTLSSARRNANFINVR